MRTPIIAIVADRKRATSGPWIDVPTDGLPHSYIAAIELAGGAPLLIPSVEANLAQARRILDAVDGLFLPGGRDVDSLLYGQEPHSANDRPLRLRDGLEIALIRGARHRRMPILGACRGLQILNVALGGTLEQHLADKLDMEPHRDVVGVFTEHEVAVVTESRLGAVLSAHTFAIASHHHQAIGELGDGLVATGFAPDGVIEAIEASDGSFCLGVQWHPEERLEPHGVGLFAAFTRAAAEYAESRDATDVRTLP